MRDRVRGGKVQTTSANLPVADQKSDLFDPPSSPNSKVYLVYVETSTGTAVVTIDSSGVEAISPAAPDYAGKLVIAEVTLAYTDTVSIPQSKIRDVRSFIALNPVVAIPTAIPVGGYMSYAGVAAPAGWLLCDGNSYDGSNPLYAALWAVIGNIYGGTSITNFKVPDMRGRIPVGVGLGFVRGASGGETSHALTAAESGMPAHSHSHSHQVSYQGGASVGAIHNTDNGSFTVSNSFPTSVNATVAGPVNASSAHNNLQPYVVANYIIKL
jgi:microcystin-dependent protein